MSYLTDIDQLRKVKCGDCSDFFYPKNGSRDHVVQTDNEGGRLLCNSEWRFN